MIRTRHPVLLAVIAMSAPAVAGILPVEDGRYVRWEEYSQGVRLSEPSSPFFDFTGQAGMYEGSAAQSSRIAPVSMSGESSYEQYGGGGVSVDSTFLVSFRVNESGRYEFSGRLFGGVDGANPYDEPDEVHAALALGAVDLIREDVTLAERVVEFSQFADLASGEIYTLALWFRGGRPFHSAGWSFEFAPMPEPSGMASLTTALLVLVARRRSLRAFKD